MRKIINRDCFSVLIKMPENCIDMVLTSPPYDNLRNYEKTNTWGFEIFKKIATELARVLKKGGVIVWVVSDSTLKGSETGSSFKQALFFKEDCGLNLHDTMIFQKENPFPVGGHNRYYQGFEYMFVFSKGKPKTFNQIEVKRKNKYKDKRTFRYKNMNRDADGNFKKKKIIFKDEVKKNNVWCYTVGGGNSVEYGCDHPATFPLDLAKDHILSWSNENDLVLDPFSGAGTTAIACYQLKRNFICIEKVKKYADLSKKRLIKTIKNLI